jgi:uncharacterized membrane protein YdjX (TVP38/TMEM64 family)
VDRRRALRALIVTCGIVGVMVAMRRTLGLEFDPESLRTAVAKLGIWGPLVFVGIVAFRVPLGLPSQVVLVGGGLIFGIVTGTLLGGIGLTISGLLFYAGSRWAGREAIESRVPDKLKSLLDLADTRLGGLIVALGTGYPFAPATAYHMAAGIAGMSLALFAISLVTGAAMRAAIYTWLGSSVAEEGIAGLAQATAVLAVVLLTPLAFPRSRAWLLQLLGVRTKQRGAEAAPPVS